jgi:alkylation response protein AidB-like acyl-CoA dehydrogenase
MIETVLSEDEGLLRETAAKFVDAVCPLPTVRELIDSGTGLPDRYLRQIGDLGWLGLLVPEEFGGELADDGVRYLAAVAQVRGRGLQPAGLASMSVVIAALCRRGAASQRADVLPALAAGERVATWLAGDVDGDATPGRAVTATPDPDHDCYILSGTGLVQDGMIADWFLVTAGGGAGPSQFLLPAGTPGLSVKPRQAHDVTQRFATVTLDGVTVPSSALVGDWGGAARDVEFQMQLAALLVVAETVGAMDALLEMTRQYALDRFSFGRPIGSFQAVKHQLADLSLSLEAANAILAAAVDALQDGRTDAGEIISMAKAWTGDVGIDIAQGCFQVFGGIGYTWEHDSHLYLRRITMNGLLFGGSDWHRERICAGHGF